MATDWHTWKDYGHGWMEFSPPSEPDGIQSGTVFTLPPGYRPLDTSTYHDKPMSPAAHAALATRLIDPDGCD